MRAGFIIFTMGCSALPGFAEGAKLSVAQLSDARVELRFIAAAGKTYQIETSSDFASWANAGEVIPGSGDEVARTFPVEQGQSFFRLRETVSPGDGLAPVALRTITITNVESAVGPKTHKVEFTGTNQGRFLIVEGALGQGTFTYTVDSDTARLVMNYEDFPGDKDDLLLNFDGLSFSGTQLTGGTSYTMSGTFEFE